MQAPPARDEGSPHARNVKERVRTELREYAIAVLYLYVCLGALLLFETGLLREQGVRTLPFGLAAGKALILGKFLVIGEAARIGARAEARTLLHLIARKVLLFLALLIVLSVLEEFVAGWLHGRSFPETLAEYEGRSAVELLATCLLMFLILVPFVTFKELGRALGPGTLRAILLSPPGRTEPPVAGKEVTP
jgi:hypothetical protein